MIYKQKVIKFKKMKTYKITKTGDYASTYEIVEGTKKQALAYLRDEALTKRKESREVCKLDKTVFSINENLHKSKLVTLASFRIKMLGIIQIIELLNAHGVHKYKIETI